MAVSKYSYESGPTLSYNETSALENVRDVYPMPSEAIGIDEVSRQLYEGYNEVDTVPDELYRELDVKRGLRNVDGSGVLVGLTTISNVHGYMKKDGVARPDYGSLSLRGYDMGALVRAAQDEERFGYEETAYLLLFGKLPSVKMVYVEGYENLIGTFVPVKVDGYRFNSLFGHIIDR